MKYIEIHRKTIRYRVAEDERRTVEIYEKAHNDYISLDRGVLIIKTGYVWDGASGPTINDKTNMTSSLVHDALYQLMREDRIDGSHRKYIDQLFRDMCIEAGMNKFRAWYYYNAVRLFAKKSSLPPGNEVIEV